jgi:hypothetical protein
MDAPKNISEFLAFLQPERPCTCHTSGECDTCRSWAEHYHEITAEYRRYGAIRLPLPMVRDAFGIPVDLKLGTRTHIIPNEHARAIALIARVLRERGEEMPITDVETLRRTIKILRGGRNEQA